MGSTVLYVTVSVDGFATGPGDDLSRLHRWLDDADGADADPSAVELIDRFRRAGAIIFGRRTWNAGQEPWGDDDVFSSPVFVLTHERRSPEAKNGTVFTFVSEGPATALAQAQRAAGDRDVVIMGSPDVAQQFLRDGLVDEILLHVVPVLLGGGIRLFAELEAPQELALRSWRRGRDVTGVAFAVLADASG
ncbi:dihydrofolate reductase family protein [Microbacterium sp. C23T]